jgi:hypothetical protein
MLYDASLAQDFARPILDEGIYVIGFFFPVVPQGQARIRVQISAAHERADLDRAIAAFEKVGRSLGVLKERDSPCHSDAIGPRAYRLVFLRAFRLPLLSEGPQVRDRVLADLVDRV